MNDEQTATAQVHDDDINTTAPQSKDEVWKMPEPVFRRTSGKLPKGFPEKVIEGTTSDDDVQAHSSDPPPPEPAVSDFAASDSKPKSPALKIVIVALALGAMIAFIVVLLSVVYFFFLR